MKNWITRARKTILDQSPWLKVEYHTVELSDGRIIPDWSWIITPDFINVVACTADGNFILLRQMKYGLEKLSLAPIGGYLNPGEEPLDAAKRELLEETGYIASEWIDLGHYRVDPNRGVAMGHLYLARGAFQVTQPTPDDLEELEMVQLTRQELELALQHGEILVLSWAAVVALALKHL
jgi:ADP-ribose pyrophosphatase